MKDTMATAEQVQTRVSTVLEALIREKGFELADVEYVKEGALWYLRLTIDREDGVDLDDCAIVSRAAGAKLDQENFIPQAYMLEVSSPGIERPLKKAADYERFRGSMVKIMTKVAVQEYQEFVGYLVGLADGQVTLEYEDKRISIPQDSIEQAHLFVDF